MWLGLMRSWVNIATFSCSGGRTEAVRQHTVINRKFNFPLTRNRDLIPRSNMHAEKEIGPVLRSHAKPFIQIAR